MTVVADHVVVEPHELHRTEHTDELEGYLHGDASVSLILVDMRPGGAVRLHRHPYGEVFVVQEGRATFTVGPDTLEVTAPPRIVIVSAGVPHAFVNSGDGPLRQVDIHLSDRFVTEWLED